MALGEATTSGLFGLGSSLLGGLFENRSIKRQLNAQKELAKYQFDLNKAQWNAENEYNSPSAQMGRLQAAGLNPNLVYDKGTVSGNTTTAGPRYEAPSVDMRQKLNLGNAAAEIIDTYQNLRMKRAQVDNIEAQTQAVQEQTNLTAIERAWRMLKKDSDAQYLNQERQAGLRKNRSEVSYLDKQNRYLGQKANLELNMFPHQLEAQKISNRNARQALTNAVLDAALKGDKRKQNVETLRRMKYENEGNSYIKYNSELDHLTRMYHYKNLKKFGIGNPGTSNVGQLLGLLLNKL